jgi:uncharacterized membrane protein
MFDSINGLPVHPLVVHAVVVLFPLAILGAVAIVFRPDWRERYGVLVVGIAGLATLAIPVATSSGEALEHRVGSPGEHAQLGDQLIWFALPLFVLLAAFVWVNRIAGTAWRLDRSKTSGLVRSLSKGPGHRWFAGLLVISALATGVQVYRVGDSGARAAWGPTSPTSLTRHGQVSGR